MIDKELLKRIPAPLLSWYDKNKRDLLWRKNPTPYHVWVSEIMLQQTRVEAVKGYYARFIEKLPDIPALANCEEETLLKLWEGLGYYSRVRNMQKTAKILVREYDGQLPRSHQALVSLPGIGEYTAGAIRSIAFGERAPAVDGNVLRVVARLTQERGLVTAPAYKKSLTDALAEVYPDEGETCSHFTQSLFELGATVCKPQNPDCKNCPLAFLCKSNESGTQSLYPVLPKKSEKRRESVYVFLLQTPSGYALRRREEGVLKGLNEFPSQVVQRFESAESVLNGWGIYDFREIARKNYVHIFTHIRWDITCVWLQTDSVPFDTYSLKEIKENISLPTAFRQCLELIEE